MTTQIVELTPTNKAHNIEHKSVSDFSFYGIANQIQKELSAGWEINNKEYPIYTGTLYTVSFKRVKGVTTTLAPPTTRKAQQTPVKAVPEPSNRRKQTVKAVVKPLTTPASDNIVDKSSNKFTYKEI